jgi:hypothetical protein
MKKSNKKTLVAGIVVCAVSSTASASNNSITANELSVSEIRFVAKQNEEASTLLNELEDSMLLKKQISPIGDLELAGRGVKDGKKRFTPSVSKSSFWDRFFS